VRAAVALRVLCLGASASAPTGEGSRVLVDAGQLAPHLVSLLTLATTPGSHRCRLVVQESAQRGAYEAWTGAKQDGSVFSQHELAAMVGAAGQEGSAEVELLVAAVRSTTEQLKAGLVSAVCAGQGAMRGSGNEAFLSLRQQSLSGVNTRTVSPSVVLFGAGAASGVAALVAARSLTAVLSPAARGFPRAAAAWADIGSVLFTRGAAFQADADVGDASLRVTGCVCGPDSLFGSTARSAGRAAPHVRYAALSKLEHGVDAAWDVVNATSPLAAAAASVAAVLGGGRAVRGRELTAPILSRAKRQKLTIGAPSVVLPSDFDSLSSGVDLADAATAEPYQMEFAPYFGENVSVAASYAAFRWSPLGVVNNMTIDDGPTVRQNPDVALLTIAGRTRTFNLWNNPSTGMYLWLVLVRIPNKQLAQHLATLQERVLHSGAYPASSMADIHLGAVQVDGKTTHVVVPYGGKNASPAELSTTFAPDIPQWVPVESYRSCAPTPNQVSSALVELFGDIGAMTESLQQRKTTYSSVKIGRVLTPSAHSPKYARSMGCYSETVMVTLPMVEVEVAIGAPSGSPGTVGLLREILTTEPEGTTADPSAGPSAGPAAGPPGSSSSASLPPLRRLAEIDDPP
jgi:hypothetical protein